MDRIDEQFGGYNEIERQIKVAKLKEQAVGNLWQKLNTCIQSTEGNLQCFKCIEIAKNSKETANFYEMKILFKNAILKK